MLIELAQKASIFQLLHQIDQDLAEQTRQQGCSHCGGPLHRACFERKPRGGPSELPTEYAVRLGLCCGWCRRRRLPPSILFWERRAYWRVVVLIVTVLRQNRINSLSARRLMELFGASRQTISRWVRYFREVFPTSSSWQSIRGQVSPEVSNSDLPLSLFEHILARSSNAMDAALTCLKLLVSGAAYAQMLMEHPTHAIDGRGGLAEGLVSSGS